MLNHTQGDVTHVKSIGQRNQLHTSIRKREGAQGGHLNYTLYENTKGQRNATLLFTLVQKCMHYCKTFTKSASNFRTSGTASTPYAQQQSLLHSRSHQLSKIHNKYYRLLRNESMLYFV